MLAFFIILFCFSFKVVNGLNIIGFLSLFVFYHILFCFSFKVVNALNIMYICGWLYNFSFLWSNSFFFLLMALVDNNGIGIIVFSANFLHNPSGEQFINGLGTLYFYFL